MKRLTTCMVVSVFLSFCTVMAGNRLFAQNIGQNNSIDIHAVEYLSIAGNQSTLYYGNEQEIYPHLHHPYLKSARYVRSGLSYCGILYPDVQLRLDWHRNELIVLAPNFINNIVLSPEHVDYAELHDLHIIYYHNDGLPGSPSTGYYILRYSGICKVFENQPVSVTVKNIHNRSLDQYHLTNSFYLYKDDIYHVIQKRSGLYKVLHPYKRELKRFASNNRLRFRKDKGNFIAMTVREYERLSGL